jgi:hypothetical protein
LGFRILEASDALMLWEAAMGYGYQGDIRRVRRGERLLDDIVRSGSLVLHRVCGDRASELAAHRFLSSAEVTSAGIFAESSARTAQACRGGYIVAAQDTTEINFSGADHHRPGLGRAGDGKSLGFFVHAVVAIDADDEAVVGLASARIWTRGRTKVTARRKRALGAKESKRWLEGCRIASAVLEQAEHVVVVGDSESDIYQLFTRRPADIDLIVRARGDRRLADGGLLFARGAQFTPVAEWDVHVAPKKPRLPGDKGRTARVALCYGPVTVKRPQAKANKTDARQVCLTLVVVREISDPGTAEPVLWRLLTTLPVVTVEDAKEIVRLYRLRWRIEQVFRVLKRDGLALEDTQVEQRDRLFNLAAMALVAATRIIQLTDARETSPRPASDVIDPDLIDAAEAIGKTLEGKTERQKNHHPKGSLTWLAWIVARLGGWNCYYKPPGPKTMATGYKRLVDVLKGFQIARNKANV